MSSSAAKSDAGSLNNDSTSTQSGDSKDNSEERQKIETLEKNNKKEEKEGDEEDDEEEGECGFCLFMKGGGCKDSFIDWENCIEEAEKNKEDVVTKCMDVTENLKKCMEAHSDYYEPILNAEKAVEEEVKKELEKENAADESAKKEVSVESEKKAES